MRATTEPQHTCQDDHARCRGEPPSALRVGARWLEYGHLVVDAVAVILSRLGVNVWIIEGAVYVIAAGLVFLAIAVWKKNHVAQAELEALSAEAAPEAEAQA